MSPSFGFVVTVQSTSQLFGHPLAVSKVALFIIYIYIRITNVFEHISRRHASQVWTSEFSFMKFRPLRLHPECTTCLKHKVLIRSLGHHVRARILQQEQYHAHLHSQYLDRLTYWSVRGIARTKGSLSLTLILDGMDQSKFAWPRGQCVKAKELAGWNRPRCHVIGGLLHGHAIFFAVTRPDIPKDSSTHIEMVAYILTRLAHDEGIGSLADYSLTLRCDNTARECKNGVMLAFLSSLIAKGASNFELNLCFISL